MKSCPWELGLLLAGWQRGCALDLSTGRDALSQTPKSPGVCTSVPIPGTSFETDQEADADAVISHLLTT